MSSAYQSRISRREALAWLAALGSTAFYSEARQLVKPAAATEAGGVVWPELDLVPVSADGYGQDPILNPPQPVPWPRILSSEQLQSIALLGEIVCPGSSAASVPDVIDEWLSAPYPMQQQHRALIIPGLVWLDNYSKLHFGSTFSALANRAQLQILAMLDKPAKENLPGLQRPLMFFNTFRFLLAGIYFTSPEGVKLLGYQGNVPLSGDYPGPSREAEAHLQQVLDSLGLESPAWPVTVNVE